MEREVEEEEMKVSGMRRKKMEREIEEEEEE